ncbi:MAG TPA: hypothetical protein VF267_03425 [Gammaproteobacteria bacterium]
MKVIRCARFQARKPFFQEVQRVDRRIGEQHGALCKLIDTAAQVAQHNVGAEVRSRSLHGVERFSHQQPELLAAVHVARHRLFPGTFPQPAQRSPSRPGWNQKKTLLSGS